MTWRTQGSATTPAGATRDCLSKTAAAAECDLLTTLQGTRKSSQAGELTAMRGINHLPDLSEEIVEEQVADSRRLPASLNTYWRAI